MNMQNVNGTKLNEAKNRLIALQENIRTTELGIQNKRDSYDRKRQSARHNRMPPAEFLALYPTQPALTAENALLVAKKAELGGTVEPSEKPLEQEIYELQGLIARKGSDYLAEKAKPSRSLTDDEFLALYPELTDGDFTVELAAISTARAEANLLGQFFMSGPNPNPGSYDVDFLTGTAIAFP